MVQARRPERDLSTGVL